MARRIRYSELETRTARENLSQASVPTGALSYRVAYRSGTEGSVRAYPVFGSSEPIGALMSEGLVTTAPPPSASPMISLMMDAAFSHSVRRNELLRRSALQQANLLSRPLSSFTSPPGERATYERRRETRSGAYSLEAWRCGDRKTHQRCWLIDLAESPAFVRKAKDGARNFKPFPLRVSGILTPSPRLPPGTALDDFTAEGSQTEVVRRQSFSDS